MKRYRILFLAFIICLAFLLPRYAAAESTKFVLVASTIGPIDSGIVETLETQFEKDSGIRVRHVGAGTGAALDISRKGEVDLVMVHAKSLEDKFVNEGYGTERIALMYNDFVIVGPAADPAGIKGMKTATEALKAIAAKQALFVTRGDKSGTHVAEMELWGKAGVKPEGSWYHVYEKGSLGNAPTLKFTDEKGAYTVIDRATVLAVAKEIKLVVLVENDEALLNFISLIPVNPKKFPRVNYEDAMILVKWLTAPEKGQLIIRDFGKEKYGAPMFFPNSKEWQAREKKTEQGR
jgi:tungstate transport system substrate-binding protein